MRNIVVVTLALTLSLTACKKDGSHNFEQVSTGTPPAMQRSVAAPIAVPTGAPMAAARDGAPNGVVGAVSTPAAQEPRFDRMIIRTATLSLIVADATPLVDRITAVAEQNGGYINDSKVWREGDLVHATLSLRVPAPRLSATLAAVRHLGIRVQNETTSSEEVTQEYVDLTAQLRNLEAAEEEMRQIMTEVRVRTKKASEVLEIAEQLRSIRGEIEQTKGRMQYLSQRSALSTVNIELVPDVVTKPVISEPGWQPLVAVKDAGRSLVAVLESIANAAIWLVIYALPVALLVALATWMMWRLVRALHRRTSAAV